ncbi:VirB4 family type IV secretion/conjugal transfer ATPase [Granulicella arctica]|uniref:VirB4 family type IV secretion/conjugal transfer ATPase n=1 Tax=Granulicella arctica TaxID=940613 RepID=UPI0021E08594|nr:hypothetical protein [Granulicella arctica]
MTRANANPWFTDAGAANSIMPIVRFVTPTVFASKTRGYGLLFEVDGADEEGLTDPEIASKMRGVEGGVRGLTEDFGLYQYMRVTSGFEIPRQKKYADPITQSFVDHRLDFLSKTANFRRIDLHWCLTLEPKLASPFAAKPKDQADENDRLISQLQKAATILETHLSSVIGLKVVGKEKAFKFFAELFNLEAWAGHIPLVSDQGVDQQIATSAVSWHNDHLRVGKRHVQMFSASSTPAVSQPCLYSSITNLTCDSVLCTTWRPQSSSTVRKEISAQEKWIDFFKVGIFQRIMAGKNFAQLDQGAGAKAASEGVDDLGLVVKELGKKAQGKYTVTLLLSAESGEELRENTPLVHRTFVDAQATVIEETIGNLSAFYAMFPFNQRYNVFSLWLGEDHHARLYIGKDNRSRQLINQAVRVELQETGRLGAEQKTFFVLAHRSDMTGADRGWAARYKTGDILIYEKGSKAHGIARNSTAVVLSADARNNTITVQQDGGKAITYDPKRLKGVNAYRETQKEFATGDRIQFTTKNKDLGVNNRDLGTITKLETGQVTVQMDGRKERTDQFDPAKMRHFDHGYAVTSHVSQGLTEGRVIANIDTDSARSLINTRLAYVAVSRAEHDARIYTNDADGLGARLATDISKTSAVDFRKSPDPAPQKNTVVQVREYADPNHRIAAVALAYAEHPSNSVVIAKDPAERRELNELIRADLQASGTVAPDSKALPVHIEKELTNPKLAAQYAPGDIIQYRQGSPASQGIPNDSAAVVVATDTRNNQLTVRTSHGDEVIYSPHLTTAMTTQSKVYREEHQEFAPGDRVRMSQPNASQGIRKGDFGTIAAIGDNLEVRLDKGESVRLTKEQAKHIEHGYAVDSLKTGAPDRVLISQDGSFQATSESVSLSRTGREVSVYTSDGSAQANAVALTIALPEQLKPAIALQVQQQSEAPSSAIALDQAPVVQHRHSRGR